MTEEPYSIVDGGIMLPDNLETDVVPAGLSGIDHERLNTVFNQLDDKILKLAQKIQTHRNYVYEDKDNNKRSRGCQMICKDMHGDAKLRCLKQCVRPIVKEENLESLRTEFPIDMRRLDQNMNLRHNFERHQRAPETITSTDSEASLISDLYAMPLATAAIPEESWARSMNVIKQKPFAVQRDKLVQNWKDRADSYSPNAQEELAHKISRHDDEEGTLMTTVRKFRDDEEGTLMPTVRKFR